jgi:1-acyl-sn-glycerol-3-phosphate acyltransferase
MTPSTPRPHGHSKFGRWLYSSLWILCRALGVSMFGVRTRFAEPLPATGGLIVLSSHQSHLDPLLLGLACDRRLSSLARSSLYRFKPFGFVITALDAVPIDREASAVAAMKTVIKRLEDGAAVIIFPEGTRTATGRLGEVKSGFALLAKRARVPIVPVAIVGAWECWPRTRKVPRPGRIRLEFGRVLWPEEIADMDERALVAECADRLERLDAAARVIRGHV